MAVKYGFYNAIGHDRVYSSEDFGQMFDGLITDGIYSTIGGMFAVVPGGGMTVLVRPGRAWFNRTWTVNTTDLPISLGVSDLLLPRIDAVILEVDTRTSYRRNSIKTIKGEIGIDPQNPSLSNSDGLYQYPLAYIRVNQNASSITASNITNCVGNVTPFCTGILHSVSIAELWNQWKDQFDDWFANVRSVLDGDVALNLQRQIDDRVKIVDKATLSEIKSGVGDSKWISAPMLKQWYDNEVTPEINDAKQGTIDSATGQSLLLYSKPKLGFGIGKSYSNVLSDANGVLFQDSIVWDDKVYYVGIGDIILEQTSPGRDIEYDDYGGLTDTRDTQPRYAINMSYRCAGSLGVYTQTFSGIIKRFNENDQNYHHPDRLPGNVYAYVTGPITCMSTDGSMAASWSRGNNLLTYSTKTYSYQVENNQYVTLTWEIATPKANDTTRSGRNFVFYNGNVINGTSDNNIRGFFHTNNYGGYWTGTTLHYTRSTGIPVADASSSLPVELPIIGVKGDSVYYIHNNATVRRIELATNIVSGDLYTIKRGTAAVANPNLLFFGNVYAYILFNDRYLAKFNFENGGELEWIDSTVLKNYAYFISTEKYAYFINSDVTKTSIIELTKKPFALKTYEFSNNYMNADAKWPSNVPVVDNGVDRHERIIYDPRFVRFIPIGPTVLFDNVKKIFYGTGSNATDWIMYLGSNGGRIDKISVIGCLGNKPESMFKASETEMEILWDPTSK